MFFCIKRLYYDFSPSYLHVYKRATLFMNILLLFSYDCVSPLAVILSGAILQMGDVFVSNRTVAIILQL